MVTDAIGHWDSVRFAGDGEFKRRLVKTFGQGRYVDLNTGPLSLPRQSTASLTGSSAFGYDGFFMGVRKEYVDSLEHHHAMSDNLYYSYPQNPRPFPVPEPMWPEREEKTDGWRDFDVIIAGDFRADEHAHIKRIRTLKENHARIGLVQLYTYDPDDDGTIATDIRDMLDGESLQMLVYGEKIGAQKLIVTDLEVFNEWQKYRPEITVETLHVAGNQQMDDSKRAVAIDRMKAYFTVTGPWHFEDDALRGGSAPIRRGTRHMNSIKGLENELAHMKKQLEAAREEERAAAATLRQRRASFNEAERRLAFTTALPRGMKQAVRTTGGFILGRRNRKWLYSSTYRKRTPTTN
ncbi:hypothetical protein ACYF68_11510 [Salinicoccus sp. CNSTN-B1]